MADRLYLSYWLRGFTEHNMLRHFKNALSCFPFSRLRPYVNLEVSAVDPAEPPLLEREFALEIRLDEIIEACRWLQKRDAVFNVATYWDLWQWQDDWQLAASPISISCFGPAFPSEYGEQLRFEFGLESQFLPQPELSDNLTPVRQNIRSLLHLVGDLDKSMAAEKRLLWSESGGNFAERLQQSLTQDLHKHG